MKASDNKVSADLSALTDNERERAAVRGTEPECEPATVDASATGAFRPQSFHFDLNARIKLQLRDGTWREYPAAGCTLVGPVDPVEDFYLYRETFKEVASTVAEPLVWAEDRTLHGTLAVDLSSDGYTFIEDGDGDQIEVPLADLPWLIQALTEAQAKQAKLGEVRRG